MRLTDQAMVGLADCAGGSPRQHAENRVGIFCGILLRADVKGPNAGVIGSVETEMLGDFAQVIVLGGADEAIGESDRMTLKFVKPAAAAPAKPAGKPAAPKPKK